MKILHTSDWHLGKKLEGKSRLLEQRDVLFEIAEIADKENVDIILIAGDIFDTSVPTAEAEELFFECALKMARDRYLVAISGNHDDADRLSAPSPIAKACNIILCGKNDYASYSKAGVAGGENYLKITIGGEVCNLLLLPYVSASQLSYTKEDSYAELINEKIQNAAKVFEDDGVNIFMSHLFVTGSEGLLSDERELGSAKLLPKNILPKNAHYTALGHIHKPLTVSKSQNAYYSGSILSYSFDDTSEKIVKLIDADKNGIKTVTDIKLSSGKKTLRVECSSFDEAIEQLDKNLDCYVEIVYLSGVPLSPSQIAEFKKRASFCKITVVNTVTTDTASVKKGKSDQELFEMFYESRTGEKPDKETVALFMDIMEGEN